MNQKEFYSYIAMFDREITEKFKKENENNEQKEGEETCQCKPQ